ncbi:UDP-N-acetylglucosamine--N-acetylmuramyl-(pentapeptide) pyrophosphoryl-undecaprenol N-acetylglucosamine transferase, partial [Psychrobacter sp.]
ATKAAYASEDLSNHEFTVQPFIDDMAAAYNWADIVVCRAGALTVTEIQNVGIAAIFVPLPHAVDDHQTANARTLTSHDAATLLPQSELTAERLSDELKLLDRATCLAMAKKGHALANRNASQQVADIIWQTL